MQKILTYILFCMTLAGQVMAHNANTGTLEVVVPVQSPLAGSRNNP